MPLFQDKTIFTNFALTEKSGGTGADLHSTAVWDEEKGKWILNGEKWLISHTDCSQFSYVICVTDPDKKATIVCPPSSFLWIVLASRSFLCLT